MMRFITIVLVLICCASFHLNAFAQDDFTGNITTLSGEKLIGKIKTDKKLFSEVQFIGLDGKLQKYAPGEIKGFSIKYPQERLPLHYESLKLDDIGTVFAQRRFSDGKIKYYYTEHKGSNQQSGLNIYTVADTIFDLANLNLNWFSAKIDYNDWLNGGIILSNKDTLRGEIFLPKVLGMGKNVKFRKSLDTEEISYKLNDLRGYFSDHFSFITLNMEEPNSKAKENEVFEVLKGYPMQIVGEENEKQKLNTFYNISSNYNYTYTYIYYEYYVKRFSGSLVGLSYVYYNYYLKKGDSDEILEILERAPTLSKKYIEKVNRWFKDYPALAEAIIAKQLTAEAPITILYNIHYAINNTK